MHTIDTQRIYAPHEAGYWAAQQHGFAMIRQTEDLLRDRDSWAGRYSGRFDHELEEWVVDDDCSDEFDEAHELAVSVAKSAARGHAVTILWAQGRDDEAALMILGAGASPG